MWSRMCVKILAYVMYICGQVPKIKYPASYFLPKEKLLLKFHSKKIPTLTQRIYFKNRLSEENVVELCF